MNTLGIAVGLLAALTLLNLFVLLGVVRRLRELSLAGAGGGGDAGLPVVGSAVSAFSAATVDGGVVTDADLRDGPALAVFLSPGCPPCEDAAAALSQRPLPERTFVFVHGHRDEPALAPMLRTLGGVGTVVLDGEPGSAAAAFGVTGYPMAVMVDGGRVAAASPDHADLLPAWEALAR